jgi:hypothetical protein
MKDITSVLCNLLMLYGVRCHLFEVTYGYHSGTYILFNLDDTEAVKSWLATIGAKPASIPISDLYDFKDYRITIEICNDRKYVPIDKFKFNRQLNVQKLEVLGYTIKFV